ncbi:MAG TPA: hypothetical protein VHF47_08365 [Acidimicrobiales bacterium]|nr:hypothetical protein [Acidimicrobiales bacterium]
MKLGKRLAAVGVGVAVLMVAAVAWASWTADGSGPGSAKAVERKTLTLSGSSAAAQLYPGSNGDIVVVINNPNPYKIAVSSVGSGTVADITSDASGCSGTGTGLSYRWSGDLSVTTTAPVVAANGTYTLTITNGLAMSNSVVDACSGATFGIPLSAKAQSTTSGTAGTTGSVTVAVS